MWKWTDENNIRVVLLDADSLNSDVLNFDYHTYAADAQVISFSLNADNNADINADSLQSVLTYACSRCTTVSSENIILISSSVLRIREALPFHIGTVLYGVLKFDDYDLAYIPDFTAVDLIRLKNILTGSVVGYAAEADAAESQKAGTKILLVSRRPISISSGRRNLTTFIGGRYYPLRRNSVGDDPLSNAILTFKRHPSAPVSRFYREAVDFLGKQNIYDMVTFIPQKPYDIESHAFSRFESLKFADKTCFSRILECNKNYSQRSSTSYLERFANVKDAFELVQGQNISDKKILILDDIRTTGATIDAAADLLYDHGAKAVSCLIPASNQMVNSYRPYNGLICRKCGAKMHYVSLNGEKTCYRCFRCGSEISISEGFSQMKKLNSYRFTSPNDLNDTY